MRITLADRQAVASFGADASESSNTDDEGDVRLRGLLSAAIASMLRTCIDHNDAARIYWQTVTTKHRERWAQGDLDAIVPILSDLLPWIREAGIDLRGNADVAALFRDPSFDKIRNWIPAIQCDPGVFDLFRQLAGRAERV